MDQKWIQILVILVFCQKITSGEGGDMIVKEGRPVEIKCKPAVTGTMVIWFRVLDRSTMDFIASFSNTGFLKSTTLPPNFSPSNIHNDVLILNSFNKDNDSGVYSCASLKGNELKFGPVTRLIGEKVAVVTPKAATTTTTEQSLCTTATPCVCGTSFNNGKGENSPEWSCSPIILGSLAGGCGLLLLLLIIITLYCNHIRTRRCPHHYKRKPRVVAPGKQMMTNRHA